MSDAAVAMNITFIARMVDILQSANVVITVENGSPTFSGLSDILKITAVQKEEKGAKNVFNNKYNNI